MPRWHSTASPWSSRSQRYLPRRAAPTTVRPSSRWTKSAGPGRWRRTDRTSWTVTPVMVRPTTWSTRPRRTTSTSGSSGTGCLGGLREVGVDAAPGDLGDHLLGLLLGAARAATEDVVADVDLGG